MFGEKKKENLLSFEEQQVENVRGCREPSGWEARVCWSEVSVWREAQWLRKPVTKALDLT